MRGRFISLEGGEGAGKSTQARAIVAFLNERGIATVATREPGGTDLAERIRELLLHGGECAKNAPTEALMFAAARADHVANVIRPALDRGEWVVCDRYVDSSRAYQGAALGLGDAAINRLHDFGSGGLLPDRTFLFDLPVEVGRERTATRSGEADDDIGARATAFHEKVRTAFLEMAESEPDRFRIVDATQPVDDVTAVLRKHVADLIPR